MLKIGESGQRDLQVLRICDQVSVHCTELGRATVGGSTTRFKRCHRKGRVILEKHEMRNARTLSNKIIETV